MIPNSTKKYYTFEEEYSYDSQSDTYTNHTMYIFIGMLIFGSVLTIGGCFLRYKSYQADAFVDQYYPPHGVYMDNIDSNFRECLIPVENIFHADKESMLCLKSIPYSNNCLSNNCCDQGCYNNNEHNKNPACGSNYDLIMYIGDKYSKRLANNLWANIQFNDSAGIIDCYGYRETMLDDSENIVVCGMHYRCEYDICITLYKSNKWCHYSKADPYYPFSVVLLFFGLLILGILSFFVYNYYNELVTYAQKLSIEQR